MVGGVQPDESAVVDHARAGDGAAFAELVARYAPMVLSLALASTGNRLDAEDVVQDTFLVAWVALPRFRGDAAFSTWLYDLARSRCADRARRAAVRPRLARYAGGQVEEASSPDPERRKTALAILRAAARLPPAQRQAVLLRDIRGFSYEEVASIQDVSVGTVRSRIAAARQRIADEVGDV
jgi:RNA polymerase sigma-70 factor (ECF subfamily)